MGKFNWQNGTLVTPARVEIGGEVYDVTPEQYSGQTPLSAENLNAMQDGIYEDIGNLNNLKTNNKSSLVDSVNESLMRTLWKNTDYTSMDSGTTITLSSSDYDIILWVFSTSVSGVHNQSISGCYKGENCVLDARTAVSNTHVQRTLTYVSDTSYRAEQGYGDTREDNNNAIPIAAIGIKLY